MKKQNILSILSILFTATILAISSTACFESSDSNSSDDDDVLEFESEDESDDEEAGNDYDLSKIDSCDGPTGGNGFFPGNCNKTWFCSDYDLPEITISCASDSGESDDGAYTCECRWGSEVSHTIRLNDGCSVLYSDFDSEEQQAQMHELYDACGFLELDPDANYRDINMLEDEEDDDPSTGSGNTDDGADEEHTDDESDEPEVIELCTETCQYSNDGECDDGGPGSLYSGCALGTDCADCGVRERTIEEGSCEVDASIGASYWEDACTQENCCEEMQACAEHSECAQYFACQDSCPTATPLGFAHCVQGCKDAYPTGNTLQYAVETCERQRC